MVDIASGSIPGCDLAVTPPRQVSVSRLYNLLLPAGSCESVVATLLKTRVKGRRVMQAEGPAFVQSWEVPAPSIPEFSYHSEHPSVGSKMQQKERLILREVLFWDSLWDYCILRTGAEVTGKFQEEAFPRIKRLISIAQ